MKLREISIENLNIPFRMGFQHASANRNCGESVMVTAISDQAARAMGEGCPRRYVTGETLESAHTFFRNIHDEILKIDSLDTLSDWSQAHTDEIDRNPAAFCAVEMAILGVLAAEKRQTIEGLLGLTELSGKFNYTAVLGTRNPVSFKKQYQHYRKMGFSDFKVKLFGDLKIDLANISNFPDHKVNELRTRLDTNNLWSETRDVVDYLDKLDIDIFALEEPLQAGNYQACKEVSSRLGVKIILDESFINASSFAWIADCPQYWIINLRVSKMGGILRSLAIAERARELGIPIIIGAQVGETSLLTRAAITVANSHRGNLIAQEGAFGIYLLEYDVVDPPLMFGKDGIIKADDIFGDSSESH